MKTGKRVVETSIPDLSALLKKMRSEHGPVIPSSDPDYDSLNGKDIFQNPATIGGDFTSDQQEISLSETGVFIPEQDSVSDCEDSYLIGMGRD